MPIIYIIRPLIPMHFMVANVHGVYNAPLKAVMEVTKWQCAIVHKYIFCSIQFILFNCEHFAPINEKQQAKASKKKEAETKYKLLSNDCSMQHTECKQLFTDFHGNRNTL